MELAIEVQDTAVAAGLVDATKAAATPAALDYHPPQRARMPLLLST